MDGLGRTIAEGSTWSYLLVCRSIDSRIKRNVTATFVSALVHPNGNEPYAANLRIYYSRLLTICSISLTKIHCEQIFLHESRIRISICCERYLISGIYRIQKFQFNFIVFS